MFQHRVSSADNIRSQAIRITELDRLLPMSYGMACQLPVSGANVGKDRRIDNSNTVGVSGSMGAYDSSAMFQLPASGDPGNQQQSPFVILPRADLEFLKQEITSLKNAMAEFRNVVTGEIQKLRQESQVLRQEMENHRCTCKEAASGNGGSLGSRNLLGAGNKTVGGDWQQSSWEVTSLSRDLTSISCTPRLGISNTVDNSSNHGFNGSCTTPQVNTGRGHTAFNNCNNNQPDTASITDQKPLVQLLPNYDVYVNKMTLQIIVNEAQVHKDVGALYVLRRLIPLVFPWEELACSRGQGLNCKSTENVGNKYPLDPTRVMACKAYMRKFCMEYDCVEPSERSVNQTFNHQVNYSRRRIRGLTSSRRRPRIPSATASNLMRSSGVRGRRGYAVGATARRSCREKTDESLHSGDINLTSNYLQM